MFVDHQILLGRPTRTAAVPDAASAVDGVGADHRAHSHPKLGTAHHSPARPTPRPGGVEGGK
ncbi:MAG: hypothetical protein ACR2MN_02555 [Acidimicrobiales bacterium]